MHSLKFWAAANSLEKLSRLCDLESRAVAFPTWPAI
jgi:hypothetical protein